MKSEVVEEEEDFPGECSADNWEKWVPHLCSVLCNVYADVSERRNESVHPQELSTMLEDQWKLMYPNSPVNGRSLLRRYQLIQQKPPADSHVRPPAYPEGVEEGPPRKPKRRYTHWTQAMEENLEKCGAAALKIQAELEKSVQPKGCFQSFLFAEWQESYPDCIMVKRSVADKYSSLKKNAVARGLLEFPRDADWFKKRDEGIQAGGGVGVEPEFKRPVFPNGAGGDGSTQDAGSFSPKKKRRRRGKSPVLCDDYPQSEGDEMPEAGSTAAHDATYIDVEEVFDEPFFPDGPGGDVPAQETVNSPVINKRRRKCKVPIVYQEYQDDGDDLDGEEQQEYVNVGDTDGKCRQKTPQQQNRKRKRKGPGPVVFENEDDLDGEQQQQEHVNVAATDGESTLKRRRPRIIWTSDLTEKLQRAGDLAEKDMKMQRSIKYKGLKAMLVLAHFQSMVPDSTIDKEKLLEKLSRMKTAEKKKGGKKGQKSDDGPGEGPQAEAAENAGQADIPEEAAQPDDMVLNLSVIDTLYCVHIMERTVQRSRERLFQAICHNCGMLLYGKMHGSHLFQRKKTPSETPARITYSMSDYQFDLPYEFSVGQGTKQEQRYYACLQCSRRPLNYYPCTANTNPTPSNPAVFRVPEVVSALRNDHEKGNAALANIFSTTQKQNNKGRRIWMHKVGEVNVVSRLERNYDGLYGYMVRAPCEQEDDSLSEKRIMAAVKFFSQNNFLFKDFKSNYETLYRYAHDLDVLPTETDFPDASGHPIYEHLQAETVGWAVPLDPDRNLPRIDPEQDIIGVQHGRESSVDLTKRLAYNDKNLEAKAWTWLFPYGYGSWYDGSDLKPMQYIKLRILSYDRRWRCDLHFSFFWVDRLIKCRLFYVAQSRTANLEEGGKVPTAEELRKSNNSTEGRFKQYGDTLPNTVVGSKSYWKSKLLELLALSSELGQPDFFITLTQNDGWPELQTVVKYGYGAYPKVPDGQVHTDAKTSSTVEYSVETTTAFFKRFEQFKADVLYNEKGPIGKVRDSWYRVEYQGRGAIHVHMVVWCEPDTIPENVVTAEFPRSEGPESHSDWVKEMRTVVGQYQIHECRPLRCFPRVGGKVSRKCRYGFPYERTDKEGPSEDGVRYNYRRRKEEDIKVVSYNLAILLSWQAHMNIQRVSHSGWELYLAKYISKAEPSFDMLLPDKTNEVERFLRTRIIGRLEADCILLGYNMCRSSRDVVWCPTSVNPNMRCYKRNAHLPKDPKSTDVYYDNGLMKYLDRPAELSHLLYGEYVRQYRIVASISGNQEEDEDEDREVEDDARVLKDAKGRSVKRRQEGKEGVPRWRFCLPHGNDPESYYEQVLVQRFPWTTQSIESIISPENISKTYQEECGLRNLIDKQSDGERMMREAAVRGLDIGFIKSIAQHMVDKEWMSSERSEALLGEIVNNRPPVREARQEVEDDVEEDMGDLGVKVPPSENIEVLKAQLNPDQRQALDYMNGEIAAGRQLCVNIVGAAGTGKSFLLKTFVACCRQQNNLMVKVMASTGIAAHLIGGCTIHSAFKMNIKAESKLSCGKVASRMMRDMDVLVMDEFSLLECKVMMEINDVTKGMADGNNYHKAFGGKHVVLLGDPAQLPAIGLDIYGSWTWSGKFTTVILDQVMRQDDADFLAMLQDVRRGNMSAKSEATLRKSAGPDDSYPKNAAEYGVNDAVIVSHRSERDRVNDRILDNMEGEVTVYTAIDVNKEGKPASEYEIKNIERFQKGAFPREIRLKVGARVLILRNIDIPGGWVNGARAEVVRIISENCIILRHLLNGKELLLGRMEQDVAYEHSTAALMRNQLPITLGWCLTTHKVQGMTLDRAYVKLDKTFFASGQAYTALSRVRRSADLSLYSFDPAAVRLSKRHALVLEYLEATNVLSDNAKDTKSKEMMDLVQLIKRTPYDPERELTRQANIAKFKKIVADSVKRANGIPVSSASEKSKQPKSGGKKKGPSKVDQNGKKATPTPHSSFNNPKKPNRATKAKPPQSKVADEAGHATLPEQPVKLPDCNKVGDEAGDTSVPEQPVPHAGEAREFSQSPNVFHGLCRTIPKPRVQGSIKYQACSGPLPDAQEVFAWKKQVANHMLKEYNHDITPLISVDRAASMVPPSHVKSLHDAWMGLDSIVGDGNCFYRAISKELFGTQEYHHIIRFHCVSFLQEHVDAHMALIADDMATQRLLPKSGVLSRQDVDAYVQNQYDDKLWAYSANCYAVAGMLGCEIRVLKLDGNGDSVWNAVCPLVARQDREFPTPPTQYCPVIYNEQAGGMGTHFTRCYHMKPVPRED